MHAGWSRCVRYVLCVRCVRPVESALNLTTKFGELRATEWLLWCPVDFTKFSFGWGSNPDPTAGAYLASPRRFNRLGKGTPLTIPHSVDIFSVSPSMPSASKFGAFGTFGDPSPTWHLCSINHWVNYIIGLQEEQTASTVDYLLFSDHNISQGSETTFFKVWWDI